MYRMAIALGVTVSMVVMMGCASMHHAVSPQRTGQIRSVSTYDELKLALEEQANPGDIIEIQPGVYYATSHRIHVGRSGTPEQPIIVRGVIRDGQRPVIDGSRVSTNRGMLSFPPDVHDIIVENLELRHALGTRHEYDMSVPEEVTEAVREGMPGVGMGGISESGEPTFGHHAAGMFFEGTNITVRNCYSHHNENGFFATRTADYILIEDCHIAHNGTLWPETHAATHNFYFNAAHQIVKNSYLHDPRDGQNFKSRGRNTIFAFNWVDEDYAYSIEQSSNGDLNTLWLGNFVAKRSTKGLWQGRIFALGDGTGIVRGTVVAVSNTFVTHFPRDHFGFSFATGTADLVLLNNVFAGPGEVFFYHNGQGNITGSNNWIRRGVTGVPEDLVSTVYGDDPGFEDPVKFSYRPGAGSELIDAGTDAQEYYDAIAVVLENATSGTDAVPSPPYLEALDDIRAALPRWEPVRKGHGFEPRRVRRAVDIGAFEYRGR